MDWFCDLQKNINENFARDKQDYMNTNLRAMGFVPPRIAKFAKLMHFGFYCDFCLSQL